MPFKYGMRRGKLLGHDALPNYRRVQVEQDLASTIVALERAEVELNDLIETHNLFVEIDYVDYDDGCSGTITSGEISGLRQRKWELEQKLRPQPVYEEVPGWVPISE